MVTKFIKRWALAALILNLSLGHYATHAQVSDCLNPWFEQFADCCCTEENQSSNHGCCKDEQNSSQEANCDCLHESSSNKAPLIDSWNRVSAPEVHERTASSFESISTPHASNLLIEHSPFKERPPPRIPDFKITGKLSN
ncbi:MAG: hypothetical protein MI748_19580 [Opitutales bacterium]|nr:hypothetical protein [Opitutales bacterium]